MEWTEDIVLHFIEEVRSRPVLWDPNNPHKKNRNKKNDSWSEIHQIEMFKSWSLKDIIEKWKNLCQSYRGYRRKIETSIRSGAGSSQVYKPTWFAFTAMQAFMHDTYMQQNTKDLGYDNDGRVEDDLPLSQRERINEETIDEPDPMGNVTTESQLGEPVIEGEVPANDSMGDGTAISGTSSNTLTKQQTSVRGKLFKSPKKLKTNFTRLKQQLATKQVNQQEAMSVACNYLKMRSDQVTKVSEQATKASTSENDLNKTDVSGLFGLLIAEKLRNIEDPYTRQVIMHEIDGIFLKYAVPSSSSTSASIPSLTSQTPQTGHGISPSTQYCTSPLSFSPHSQSPLYPQSPSPSTIWPNYLLSPSPSPSNNSTPTYRNESNDLFNLQSS